MFSANDFEGPVPAQEVKELKASKVEKKAQEKDPKSSQEDPPDQTALETSGRV